MSGPGRRRPRVSRSAVRRIRGEPFRQPPQRAGLRGLRAGARRDPGRGPPLARPAEQVAGQVAAEDTGRTGGDGQRQVQLAVHGQRPAGDHQHLGGNDRHEDVEYEQPEQREIGPPGRRHVGEELGHGRHLDAGSTSCCQVQPELVRSARSGWPGRW